MKSLRCDNSVRFVRRVSPALVGGMLGASACSAETGEVTLREASAAALRASKVQLDGSPASTPGCASRTGHCAPQVSYDPASSVYVAPHGDDAHTGLAPAWPVRHIATAIEIARQQDREHILVAAGEYDEVVRHNEAVEPTQIKTILGGFDQDFTQRLNQPQARSDPSLRTRVRELRLAEMREAVTVDGFVLEFIHVASMDVTITHNTVLTQRTGLHLYETSAHVAYNYIATPLSAAGPGAAASQEVVGIDLDVFAKTQLIHHNVINLVGGAASERVVGIDNLPSAGEETLIANNSLLLAGVNHAGVTGIIFEGGTLVSNNVIDVQSGDDSGEGGTCIEAPLSSLDAVRNNDLHCRVLWASFEGEEVHDLEAPMSPVGGGVTTLASVGNFKLDPAPHWDGAAGFALAESAPVKLRAGGRDLSALGIVDDWTGAPHDRGFAGDVSPTNAGAEGWSVGVYEAP